MQVHIPMHTPILFYPASLPLACCPTPQALQEATTMKRALMASVRDKPVGADVSALIQLPTMSGGSANMQHPAVADVAALQKAAPQHSWPGLALPHSPGGSSQSAGSISVDSMQHAASDSAQLQKAAIPPSWSGLSTNGTRMQPQEEAEAYLARPTIAAAGMSRLHVLLSTDPPSPGLPSLSFPSLPPPSAAWHQQQQAACGHSPRAGAAAQGPQQPAAYGHSPRATSAVQGSLQPPQWGHSDRPVQAQHAQHRGAWQPVLLGGEAGGLRQPGATLAFLCTWYIQCYRD